MLNLTDDMFVVEAASFVVPYILEKPAEMKIGQFLEDLESNIMKTNKTSVVESDGIAKDAIKQKPENDDDDVICDEEATRKLSDKTNPQRTRKTESGNYFRSPIGSFFIEIGENLVKENVQFELLKLQTKKVDLENVNIAGIQDSANSLSDNFLITKERNAVFNFQQKTCKFCNFKTESLLIMEHHLESPHMNNNIFMCNFCPYGTRSPQEILRHVKSAHATQARLLRQVGSASCANCPYEGSNGKRLRSHLVTCAKKFVPEINLCPNNEDWGMPAKITKVTRGRHSPSANSNPDVARTTVGPKQLVGAPVLFNGQVYSPDRSNLPRNNGNADLRQQSAIATPPLFNAPGLPSRSTSLMQKTFVICEICDGYIQNMEQLRKHLHWIHKIQIHPKMLTQPPPLSCERCQFRFFTDQGLERHLLGSHALVTTSMQQAALRAEDSGRCPTCGRVYQWKLLKHMARDHGMKLKPAQLSYKCSVCSAMFAQYDQFSQHMYCSHKKPKRRPDEDNNNN